MALEQRNFECFSKAGTFRAEWIGYDSWNIYSINFHGDKCFVDWTNNREDAVRLTRMHAHMELPTEDYMTSEEGGA